MYLNFEDKTLEAVGQFLEKSLHILYLGRNKISDSGILSLVKCENITILDINGCKDVSDESLVPLVKSLRRLSKVYLGNCFKVSNKSVIAIAETSRENLDTINLNNLTLVDSDCVISLSKNCPNLREFGATSPEIKSEALCKLFESSGSRMTGVKIDNCTVGDSVLFSLSTHCPNLRQLSCRLAQLTNSSIEALARNCTRLMGLKLSDAFKLTSGCLVTLAFHCRNILEVNLAGCEKVTDEAVVAISIHCKLLLSLNINRFRNKSFSITNESLFALAENSPQLSCLQIMKCYPVDEQGIKRVVSKCTQLTRLALSGIPNVNQGLLEWLVQEREFRSLYVAMCEVDKLFIDNYNKFKKGKSKVFY